MEQGKEGKEERRQEGKYQGVKVGSQMEVDDNPACRAVDKVWHSGFSLQVRIEDVATVPIRYMIAGVKILSEFPGVKSI